MKNKFDIYQISSKQIKFLFKKNFQQEKFPTNKQQAKGKIHLSSKHFSEIKFIQIN